MHSAWAGVTAFLAHNWVELVGSVTGGLSVWLLVRQNIWNWPIGITNNIFYIVIFYQSGLYADAGLQFVYIAISIYGWWNWLHGGLEHTELKVTTASTAGIAGYLGLAAASTAALYRLLKRFTPSTVPFADGVTVALFMTAQLMMSKKIIQNWWFWIIGDALAIGLYIYKHLYLTSILYAVFLAMCIAGLLEWKRAGRRMKAVAA